MADVLGYSCRLPESASTAEFWQNLSQGVPEAIHSLSLSGSCCPLRHTMPAHERWDAVIHPGSRPKQRDALSGVDMTTQDDRRWPLGQLNTPPRIGKLPDYHRFDASFFAVHGQQAEARCMHWPSLPIHCAHCGLLEPCKGLCN